MDKKRENLCRRGIGKLGKGKSRAEMGEGMGMRCRNKSRLCAVPTAMCFLAAICFLVALPRLTTFARGIIDTGRECTLTVKTEILVQDGEEENADWSELNEREIQVYLYRVAYVNQYGEYEGTEGFEGLGLEEIDSTVKADDWREKAIAAADLLGLPVSSRPEDTEGAAAGEFGEPMGMEQPTLPEAMALPEDLPDKLAQADGVITVESGIGTKQGLPQGMYLVWVMPVETDSYQYTFLPYLVSLPNNNYDPSIPNSADEWEYETTVGLKPRQNLLYGSLRIKKTLNTYNETLGEAMFVFRVEARKDLNHDGEKEVVYSNVIGLEFDAAGQKEALIEHIPAGSEVTVEEVYSGSAYTLQGSSNIREITVWAEGSTEQPPAVEFTNDYDNRITYGTGAVNHFTHDDTGWLGKRVQGSEGGGGK